MLTREDLGHPVDRRRDVPGRQVVIDTDPGDFQESTGQVRQAE